MATANRLAGETSPYLLQHAGNPVDWYPWGAEALARARDEDRPVLLSIGYAACHWCHVMAHECFEDPAIAALMNRLFVNVKVDREERPDLDQFYQAAAQVLGSSGGWPLTVFLLPDGSPFFAGTYFPPQDRFGRPGFPRVLAAVARVYRERRPEVEAVARRVREAVERLGRPRAGGAEAAPAGRGEAVVAAAVRGLLRQADPVHGGFGGAPKFPMAPGLALLLWAVRRLRGGEERRAAGEHALLTLRRMAAGGVCDQLGGGFHRYAVDAAWTVPHFEKMLYDNALLLPLYAGAVALAGDESLAAPAESEAFAATARDTAGFLLREMAAPEGGFCASLDADSPGPDGRPREGFFYTWTPAELAEALGPAEAAEAARLFGVTDEGDVEGRSILRLAHADGRVARPDGPLADADGSIARWRELLLAARQRRPRPARDDKVVAGWNGLAVSGLAVAGRLLAEPAWVAAAQSAASFVLERLRSPDGDLLRAWRGRPAPAPGFLDDHAYLCLGLLDLYTATLEEAWLREAHRLAERIVDRFWVPEEGWFRTAPGPAGELTAALPASPAGAGGEGAAPGPATWAEVHDGSLPAAGGAAVLALLRVHHHTGEGRVRAAAEAALRAQAGELERRPHACATLAMAWDLAADGPTEVTLLGDPADPVLAGWRARLGRLFLPDLVLSVRQGDGAAPAATVCRRFACHGPVRSWDDLAALLR